MSQEVDAEPMDTSEFKGPRTPEDPAVDEAEQDTVKEETSKENTVEQEEIKSAADDGEIEENEGTEDVSDGEIVEEETAINKPVEEKTETIVKDAVASEEGEISDVEEKPVQSETKKEKRVKEKEKDHKKKVKKEKKKEKSKHRKRSRSRSPSRHRKRSRSPARKSPVRHRDRDVHSSSRRFKADVQSKKKKSKMGGNPMIMLNKCFSLIQFGEHQASQIGDDEMRKYIKELITLGKYVDKLSSKRNILKSEMENIKNNEMKLIQKMHSEMPRHMQNVLHFDGHTVHIAQDRNPFPMMMAPPPPFGMPAFMTKFPPPPGMIPPPGFPMGQVPTFPPPPGGMLQVPTTGAQGMGNMSAPPPFPGPPMPPAAPASTSNLKASHDVRKFGSPKPQEEKGAPTPPTFNPIAFSNPPPSLINNSEDKPHEGAKPLLGATFRPPGEAPNPPVNLTNFLTSAVKAHVSQSSQSGHSMSPFSAPPPTAPPTKPPSLMSLQTREPVNINRGPLVAGRPRKRQNNEEE